jgi:hypothetical protein
MVQHSRQPIPHPFQEIKTTFQNEELALPQGQLDAFEGKLSSHNKSERNQTYSNWTKVGQKNKNHDVY